MFDHRYNLLVIAANNQNMLNVLHRMLQNLSQRDLQPQTPCETTSACTLFEHMKDQIVQYPTFCLAGAPLPEEADPSIGNRRPSVSSLPFDNADVGLYSAGGNHVLTMGFLTKWQEDIEDVETLELGLPQGDYGIAFLHGTIPDRRWGYTTLDSGLFHGRYAGWDSAENRLHIGYERKKDFDNDRLEISPQHLVYEKDLSKIAADFAKLVCNYCDFSSTHISNMIYREDDIRQLQTIPPMILKIDSLANAGVVLACSHLYPEDELTVTAICQENDGPISFEVSAPNGQTIAITSEQNQFQNAPYAVGPYEIALLLPHLRATPWKIGKPKKTEAGRCVPIQIRFELANDDPRIIVDETARAVDHTVDGRTTAPSRLESQGELVEHHPIWADEIHTSNSDMATEDDRSELNVAIEKYREVAYALPYAERPTRPAAIRQLSPQYGPALLNGINTMPELKEQLKEQGVLPGPKTYVNKRLPCNLELEEVAPLVAAILGKAVIVSDDEQANLLPRYIAGVDLRRKLELRETIVCARTDAPCEVGKELSFKQSAVGFSSICRYNRFTLPELHRPMDSFGKKEPAERVLRLPNELVQVKNDKTAYARTALRKQVSATVVESTEIEGRYYATMRLRIVGALLPTTVALLLRNMGIVTEADLNGDLAWRYRLERACKSVNVKR